MKNQSRNSAVILAVALLAMPAVAQTVPSLINYQGRLTDPTGAPLAIGNYGLQFRLWDSATNTAPSGLIWAQQQNVAVQANGVFNVVLGAPGGSAIPGASPAVNDLNYAFTATNRFLGVTVASSNGVALASLAEIAPRQQFLSVPFAMSSQRAQQVADGAIGSQQIAGGAVGAPQIAAGGIQTSNLADGLITIAKLSARIVGTNVPAGGLAISLPIISQRLTASTFEDVTNLTVSIETTGRPVVAFVAPWPLNNFSDTPANVQPTGLHFVPRSTNEEGWFRLLRDGGVGAIATRFGTRAGGASAVGYASPIGTVIDLPPPGSHTYKLQWGFDSAGSATLFYAEIYNSVLVVFEL